MELQNNYCAVCTCNQPFGGVKPPCPVHERLQGTTTVAGTHDPMSQILRIEIDQLRDENRRLRITLEMIAEVSKNSLKS